MKGTGLRWISLGATLALTSHAEYAAGIAAGLPLWHPWGHGGDDGLAIGLPWLLPVAIDCYVVDALERRHGLDRWAALGILALSVVGGSTYVADTLTEGLKAAGVGVVLVLVLARLYAPAKPSRREVAVAAAAEERARVEESARTAERLAAEQAAADLRVAEAEQLAAIESARTQAGLAAEQAAARLRIDEAERVAAADGLRVRADAEAGQARERAAAELRITEAERLARIDADRARELAAADVDRIAAESAAEVARVRAQAELESANLVARQSANRRRAPARTASPATSRQSANPPAKDEAIRLVAAAIRSHPGPGPYVMDWSAWSAKHGGGKTFWFDAKKAAEAPPHLAEAAS